MTDFISKDQFLQKKRSRTDVVDVSELAEDENKTLRVMIKEMPEKTFEKVMAIVRNPKKGRGISSRVHIVKESIVDSATLELMFSDEDLPELAQMPVIVLERIAKAAMALNGFDIDSADLD